MQLLKPFAHRILTTFQLILLLGIMVLSASPVCAGKFTDVNQHLLPTTVRGPSMDIQWRLSLAFPVYFESYLKEEFSQMLASSGFVVRAPASFLALNEVTPEIEPYKGLSKRYFVKIRWKFGLLEVNNRTFIYNEDIEVVASGKTEKAAWINAVDKAIDLIQDKIRQESE